MRRIRAQQARLGTSVRPPILSAIVVAIGRVPPPWLMRGDPTRPPDRFRQAVALLLAPSLGAWVVDVAAGRHVSELQGLEDASFVDRVVAELDRRGWHVTVAREERKWRRSGSGALRLTVYGRDCMLYGFGAVRRTSSKASLQARSTPSGSFGGEIGGRRGA